MTVPAPPRDARGRVLPGHSLNPGGRPKGIEAVRERLRHHEPAAEAALVGLFASHDEGVRLAAVREFYDRYVGKPVQVSDASVSTFDINSAFLEAVRAVNAAPTPSNLINVTPQSDEPADLIDDNSDADAHRRKEAMHDQTKPIEQSQDKRSTTTQPATTELWPGPKNVEAETALEEIEW